ncbi:MAG: GNAT family N-acetyltransferase [Pseudomonadota bacterium]
MTVTLSNTPVLETDRLILRAPHAGDWPYWKDMALSDRAEFVRAPDINESVAWRGMGHIIGHWVLHGWGSFIITRKGDDAALGMTGPWFPAGWPEKELGWAIWSPAAEGTGFAFEAATAARDYAFETLGWPTAVSYIHRDNARSIKLAQRLGAVLEPGSPTPVQAAPSETDSDEDNILVYRHPTPGAQS